jgi:enoyl-CoA hydratase/carnithine racemase
VATEAVAGLPQISVAIIQGHCVGGAALLAAACDVRICSHDSRFWIPELEAGIPLAWGGMAHLVRLVGETMATDLVLTCRPIDAQEALRAGFVSRVIPAEDLRREADALVGSIASKAGHPLLVTKRQLRAIRSGSFDPRRDAEALLQSVTDPEAGESLRTYTDRLR